ncbi:MAG: hypothetical protein IPJ04_10115 [Candidatus Eisenbacteria bacterium]|nr:hypothetical protein [Candidatus Eisenbacteria bacterium]
MNRSLRMFAASLCLMGAVLTTTTVSAANLLTNGDFETGTLAPWAGVGGLGVNSTIIIQSPANGPTLPGTYSAFLDNRAEANGLTMAQTTALGTAVPGTVFYSYDLKLGTAQNGGVFFVEIFAQNAVGAVIGNAGLQGNYTPAGWTHFSGSFVAPANTDHLTIQFEAPTGAVNGSISSMSVDNVNLNQGALTSASNTTWGRIKGLYR